MTISFEPVPGRLYDLIQVIKHGINRDSYDRTVALAGIAPDQAVTDAVQTVWRTQEEEIPGVRLFFTRMYGPDCFMGRYYFRRLRRFPSVEEMIRDLAGADGRELGGSLLAYLDRDSHKAPYYEKLMTDPAALYAFAQALDTTPVIKWELISLINDPGPMLAAVTGLMTGVAERLADICRRNAKDIDNFTQRLEAKIRQDPAQLLGELGHIERRPGLEEPDCIVASCSFMEETTLEILRQEECGCACVILGIHYQKVLGTHYVDNDPINLDATLKALSDSARLKILQMLAIQDMYVAEIAQAIGKGMSTTSYHLDLLHYAGLVLSRNEGKRTYYVIDRKNFQKRLELLERFVGVRGR